MFGVNFLGGATGYLLGGGLIYLGRAKNSLMVFCMFCEICEELNLQFIFSSSNWHLEFV